LGKVYVFGEVSTDYTNLSEREGGREGERESGWRKWWRCG